MLQSDDMKRFDWILFGTAYALSLLGIAFLWGIVRWNEQWHRLPPRQVQWLVISTVVLLVILFIDYLWWRKAAWVVYGLSLASLIILLVPRYLPFLSPIVKLIVHTENNSTRWLRYGPLSVQPSEFAKIAVVLILAHTLTHRRDQLKHWRGLIMPAILTLAPMLLIFKQPDLGTTLLFVPTLLIMLFAAGARPRHLGIIMGAGLACAPLMWMFMKPQQKGRILGFLWPELDPQGTGWHITRSIAAVIDGGVTGNGFSSGAPILQSKGFKAFNDFIFAGIAHELGFIGSICVIALFAIFFTRCVVLAERARNPFGRLLIVGMLSMLALQTFINIGMTIRLCPITGMPLPFMSQGGSSLLVCFIMVGFMLNAGMRRRPTMIHESFS
jgi:rod shape determining protein RodA